MVATGGDELEQRFLELENGSKILASSTSASAVRGGSYNIIFLDEFGYVPANVAEQFFSSVYPTISSGKTTKVMIVSTLHSMNMFYKLWVDAEEEKRIHVPIEVHWSVWFQAETRHGRHRRLRIPQRRSSIRNLNVSSLVLLTHLSHHPNFV